MAKKKFYSVVSGYAAGIYEDWETCEKNIKGFSKAKYKGFSNREDAANWYKENGGDISFLSEQCIEKKTALNANADFENFFVDYGFENLNTVQKNAVQTVNGKSLLFAVPGSGKTTVIIARTGYLLYGQKDFPITADMLVNLTFTRAAATEMIERYSKNFDKLEANEIPIFKTIHSFCWSEIIPELKFRNFPMPHNLINNDPQENFKIMSSDTNNDFQNQPENTLPPQKSIRKKNDITLYSILKNVLKHFKLPFRDDTVREKISCIITLIKNRQLTRDEYQALVVTIKNTPFSVAKIFETYQAELNNRQCMDYDDMLSYSLEGLRQYPDLLEKIRNKYLYWSVDEAQDNSKLQNELISLLVGKTGNLFVVGDDDQSIYSFRGAEPKFLLEYKKTSTKVLVMNVNYRSGKNIVRVAKAFIEKNKCREPKEIIAAENAAFGKINFFTALPTLNHQYLHILKRAANCIRNGKSLAVIYRLNASSFPVMFWLRKYGINFQVKKDYQEIAYGKIFRYIISLLTFAIYPSDFDAFKNCRYLLKIFLTNNSFEIYARQIEQNIYVENILDWAAEVQPDLKNYIEKAKIYLQEIKSKTPFDAVKYILQNLIVPKSSAASRLRAYGILAACIPFKTIEEFLAVHFELLENAQRGKFVKELITLTSMHSAKGLEFDNVIIIDEWNEIVNQQSAKNSDELEYTDAEEERRLFYVAVTRAKKILDICVVKKYFENVEEPADFIIELAQCYEFVADKSVRELPINPDIETFPEYKFNIRKLITAYLPEERQAFLIIGLKLKV